MEEAPENGKESSYSAHANGMNEEYRVLHKLLLARLIRFHDIDKSHMFVTWVTKSSHGILS